MALTKVTPAVLAAAQTAITSVGTLTGLAVGNVTTTGYIRGPASFTIDPATHGNDTGTVIIAGNLQVDGTTTTINSTTVAIDDLNFSIATDAADSAAANGAGITIGGASATLLYTHATTSWDMNKPLNVTGAITATTNMVIGNGTTNELPLSFSSSSQDFSIGANGNNFILTAHLSDLDSNQLLTITSGGYTGIGTASPSSYYAKNLVVNSGAEGGITIVGGTGHVNYLMFADGTSGNERYRGYIEYSHATDTMKLNTGASPRLTIDASGNTTFSGTIASGSITSTGNVAMNTGAAAGKFAVMTATVHGSYDFYNNGTTYLNGGTIIDDFLDLTGSSGVLKIGGTTVIDNNKRFLAADGAVNVPYYTFGSDTDTGLWRPTTNTIAFSTAATERMRIDASGKVGIGHTVPESILHLRDTSSNAIVQTTWENDARKWRFGVHGGMSDSMNLYDETASASRFTVTSAGNVGIGATDPAARFHVYEETSNTTTVSNIMRLESRTSGTAGVGFGGAIYFLGERGNDGSLQGMAKISAVSEINTGSNLSSALTFQTATAGTNTEKMRITNTGTVLVDKTATGIGTAGIELTYDNVILGTRDGGVAQYLNRLSSDGSILEFMKDGAQAGSIGVNGTYPYIGSHGTSGKGIKITDALLPATNSGAFNDADVNLGASNVRWKDLYLSGTVNALKLDITAGTDARIYTSNNIGEVGSGIFAIQSISSDASTLKPLGFRAEDIRFATGSAERLRIDSSGNVGIGTTGPAHKLSIGPSASSIHLGYDSTAANTEVGRITSNTYDVDNTSYSLAEMTYNTSSANGYTGNIQFRTNSVNSTNSRAAVRMTIDDDGLKFGADTAAANALDDYEEGTWTPTISSDASPGGYTTQTGYYTKIGRKVHVTGQLRISSVGSFSGATINVSGLPATIANLTNYDPRGTLGLKSAGTQVNAIFVRGVVNTQYMRLELNNGLTTADRNMNANAVDTDTIVYVDLTYFAA